MELTDTAEFFWKLIAWEASNKNQTLIKKHNICNFHTKNENYKDCQSPDLKQICQSADTPSVYASSYRRKKSMQVKDLHLNHKHWMLITNKHNPRTHRHFSVLTGKQFIQQSYSHFTLPLTALLIHSTMKTKSISSFFTEGLQYQQKHLYTES